MTLGDDKIITFVKLDRELLGIRKLRAEVDRESKISRSGQGAEKAGKGLKSEDQMPSSFKQLVEIRSLRDLRGKDYGVRRSTNYFRKRRIKSS
jgi:hypothetical protein